MSKLATLLGVLGVAAAGGLAAWNVALQAELDELRAGQDVGSTRPVAAETSRDAVARPSRAAAQKMTVLEERITTLEVTRAQAVAPERPEIRRAAAATPEEVDALMGDLPEVLRTDEFRRAVVGVLDAREAERRRVRIEKEADRLTDRALAKLEVTDIQRADYERLTLDYLLRRDELRRNKAFDEATKREQLALLNDELTVAQKGVVGDELYAAIEKRRDTLLRRRADPRRGPRRREGSEPRRKGGNRKNRGQDGAREE